MLKTKMMNLLTSITICLVANASAFSPPLHACNRLRSPILLLASSSDSDTSPFFADEITCGPGFQRIEGTDGPCCAYDFDVVSSKLSSTENNLFGNNPELLSKYEEKNKSRKKFGLPALSPEEFVVLQAQIHAMEREQSVVQSVAKQAAVDKREEKRRQEQLESEPSLLQSFMGSIFTDTCQSNFDCDRPQVCCDFSFKKICCDEGGTRRDIENELALIPVPQRG